VAFPLNALYNAGMEKSTNTHSETVFGEVPTPAELPKNLDEAVALTTALLSDDELLTTASNPGDAHGTWEKMAKNLGCRDNNRFLLMDCVGRNTFKDKPNLVEFSSWVTLMTAAEKKLGGNSVEKLKFKPVQDI